MKLIQPNDNGAAQLPLTLSVGWVELKATNGQLLYVDAREVICVGPGPNLSTVVIVLTGGVANTIVADLREVATRLFAAKKTVAVP